MAKTLILAFSSPSHRSCVENLPNSMVVVLLVFESRVFPKTMSSCVCLCFFYFGPTDEQSEWRCKPVEQGRDGCGREIDVGDLLQAHRFFVLVLRLRYFISLPKLVGGWTGEYSILSLSKHVQRNEFPQFP